MISYVLVDEIAMVFLILNLKIGINTDVTKPLSIKTLEGMNLGQLQMIVNDLYCQIEGIIIEYSI